MNQPEELKNFLGEEEFQIVKEGINIQIMLSDLDDSKYIVSEMSRQLGMNFVILNGEMSRYRDQNLGFLVINFKERKEEVEAFLNSKNVIWRYYNSNN